MESYFDLVKRFTTKKTLPAASPACLILFDPVSWLRTTPESVAMWPCGHVAMSVACAMFLRLRCLHCCESLKTFSVILIRKYSVPSTPCLALSSLLRCKQISPLIQDCICISVFCQVNHDLIEYKPFRKNLYVQVLEDFDLPDQDLDS